MNQHTSEMCWSAEVSVGFGLIHVAAMLLTRRASYKIFCSFYALMEFYQAAQWMWGDVGSCTPWNSQVTFVAYFLIWVQPLLFVAIGKAEGLKLGHMEIAAQMTYIMAMLSLALGLSKAPTYSVPDSSFGNVTCTTIGPHGHLAWMFSPITVAYQPTHFVYVMLIWVTCMKYPPQLQLIKWGWAGTLLISICSVGVGAELPAVWCGSSVLVSVPIAIYELITRVQRLKEERATRNVQG